ncbi:hypothetical protein [Granulicella tundricola]|uniref:Uncharacterized protein n=1 Tax=Granulicella tundricola (strain ATCC BAA-1859 / DSM 23138 / MP5ACTX9) TaxID=1198114 RepID=E8X2Q0_GRATM|nr:hypothetical protein [Granulicella tundricola]ADW70347.1 hypothetical protein AciX9_3339 [Granulicella tundricola MP5ACTX9]
MKLVNIGGYHINPAAIAYVSAKTVVSQSPAGRSQQTIIHFIGGGDLQLNLTPGDFAQQLATATAA